MQPVQLSLLPDQVPAPPPALIGHLPAVQGVLPCPEGERQVLLVAASIAAGIPVDLREAALCMDAVNAARAAGAVCHAAGRRVRVVTEAGQ